MLKLSEIRRVHIEITTRCNARCPMCMRNYRGFDYNSGYPDTELTLEQIKQIFTPELLAQLALNPRQGASFNGNLGDFAVSKDGVEIVEFFCNAGVRVNINTNGSSRTPAWWAKLAHPMVQVGFALDGLADTHSLYRQDTDWNKIIENAQAYIAAGGIAIWRFVPFDHNRHQEEQCKQLAKDLGFARFENIYGGRSEGPVYSRTGEFSHWLGPPQEPKPIEEMVESHITWFNPKTIRHPKDTEKLNLMCGHKVSREIYLAADGTVYPCCYLGFYPKQMHHAGNVELKEIVQENNALIYGLEHSMAWFDRVEETWSKSSIADGRMYACVASCGK